MRLLFVQAPRETDRFFAGSGVQLAQSDRDQFHYRRTAFSSQLKSRVGDILAKAAALRITLNLDGTPITSKSHTHPSHSQTSCLLISSLSLGVPVTNIGVCQLHIYCRVPVYCVYVWVIVDFHLLSFKLSLGTCPSA